MKSAPLPSKAAIAAGVAAGVLLWITGATLVVAIEAQERPPELPPFPILYGGRALLDGEPLAEGTRLVARVGNYEKEVAVEEDGHYRNLLVSPPSGDYFNERVTFHALGLTAAEEDVFLRTAGPVFKDVGFDIHFTQSAPDEVSAPAADTGGDFTTPGRFLFVGLLLLLAILIGRFVAHRVRAG